MNNTTIIIIIVLAFTLTNCKAMELVTNPPEEEADVIALFQEMSPEEQGAICNAGTTFCAGFFVHTVEYQVRAEVAGTAYAHISYFDPITGTINSSDELLPFSKQFANVPAGKMLYLAIRNPEGDGLRETQANAYQLSLLVDNEEYGYANTSAAANTEFYQSLRSQTPFNQ
jgi:hypothetical protein